GLRLGKLFPGLRKLCFCLINRGLKRTRVDLKQNLTLGHYRTFPITLTNQIAADLRLNLCVDKSIESPNPISSERHVTLANLDDRDGNGFWRRGGRLGSAFAAACYASNGHSGERGACCQQYAGILSSGRFVLQAVHLVAS